MLWPAESIYDGTWGSGAGPPELADYEIMREMGWSWADLEATPAYVRRYCSDFTAIRRRIEAEAIERERHRHGG